MAAIILTSSDEKNIRRVPASFDQNLSYSQGFFFLITPASTPSITDVINASGQITLPNVYPVGRNALRVYIDGILLLDPASDYTENTNRTFTLDSSHVNDLDAASSNILVIWQRFLPGVRDQDLSDLANVVPDTEDAILDPNTLRVAVADATNPFITLEDLDTVGAKTFTCTATESVGDLVFPTSADTVAQAQANAFNTSKVIGVITEKPTSTSCRVRSFGEAPGSGFSVGDYIFLSDTTPGASTNVAPSASGTFVVPVGIATDTDSYQVILWPIEENP